MNENILKIADYCDDVVEFEVVDEELTIMINDQTAVELSYEDILELKLFLDKMFPSSKTSPLGDLGCMQSVGEALVMDSRQLPANITLNVTGNVTINN